MAAPAEQKKLIPAIDSNRSSIPALRHSVGLANSTLMAAVPRHGGRTVIATVRDADELLVHGDHTVRCRPLEFMSVAQNMVAGPTTHRSRRRDASSCSLSAHTS